MTYAVIEKDLATETILSVVVFNLLVDANEYADRMMTGYIEERAYKVIPVEPEVPWYDEV